MKKTLTREAYEDQGITALTAKKVADKQGREYYPKKVKSPQAAIKMFCRECMGLDRRQQDRMANAHLVAECSDPMCPLFDFRDGKNPFRKRTMTDEQKKEAVERMKHANPLH